MDISDLKALISEWDYDMIMKYGMVMCAVGMGIGLLVGYLL